jgi:peptide/nickel transport system substrate-binding protein
MKKTKLAIPLAALLLAAGLAACSDGDTSGGDTTSGGTFVGALTSDPGSLVPMRATALATWAVLAYHYESLVFLEQDGSYSPWLASEWTSTGTQAVFTIRDDITCADGEPFTAETAANNLNFHADPANATFYYGSVISEAVSAVADGNTLTVTSAVNNPFLVGNVGTIQMVCQSGLDDPDSLEAATGGTGLYVLSEVAPQTSYTFTKRDGYVWGPNGVTSETEGLPDTIQIRIIGDESTTANLMLSGEINAATIYGADRARLDAAGFAYTGKRNPIGEILFNERYDRVTSDPLVREALSVALNRDEVGEVVTDGTGVEALSLVNQPPMRCVGEGPLWTLPATSLEKAGQLLDEAGWTLADDGLRYKDGEPLTVKFIYDGSTATHAAAAELVQQTWNQLGVTTVLSGNDATMWSEQLWMTFDWDLGFVQITPGSPVVLATFFDGADPENGGLNFMFVENPEYEALAAQARVAESEDAACALWREAEAELIERYDAFPVSDMLVRTYMTGYTFEMQNYIIPTSLRVEG